LIIVLQSWSNEVSSAEAESLLSFAPLTRMVVCYGAWCESDGRNHQIWPPSVRVPVWGARSRIAQEWRLIQDPAVTFPVPLTASRDDVFVAEIPEVAKVKKAHSFEVDSPDPEYARFLSELIGAVGHTNVASDANFVLFDFDPWGPTRAHQLATRSRQFPGAALIGLTNLPDFTLEAESKSRGVSRCLPKLGRSLLDWFAGIET
jgi:hypothetical protein